MLSILYGVFYVLKCQHWLYACGAPHVLFQYKMFSSGAEEEDDVFPFPFFFFFFQKPQTHDQNCRCGLNLKTHHHTKFVLLSLHYYYMLHHIWCYKNEDINCTQWYENLLLSLKLAKYELVLSSFGISIMRPIYKLVVYSNEEKLKLHFRHDMSHDCLVELHRRWELGKLPRVHKVAM